MSKIYYISDLHFDDERIFKLCNRPFASVEEMKNCVVKKWNLKVKDSDIVYVLGDIASEENPKSIETYRLLKGRKHLIVGNHDHKILEMIKNSNIFESIKFIDTIKDENRSVCICHYPLMDWIDFKQSYFVYGHIHNKSENDIAYKQIKAYYADKLAFNCSADVIDFEPVSLQDLISLKERKKNETYIH